MQLYAFDSSIKPLGPIEGFTGLSWENKFTDAGSFELWCNLNSQNESILKQDNIIWPGEETAGIVEYIHKEKDTNGVLSIHVKGRLTVAYLDYRTIYPRIAVKATPSQIISTIVRSNLVSPTNSLRRISTVELNPVQPVYGTSISYQRLGSTALIEASTLAESNRLGFIMKFLPDRKKHQFEVRRSTDRSVNQASVKPVVFSSDLNDILSAEYSENKSEYRNQAYVAGEGEGSNRIIIETGSEFSTPSGLQRRELFVDARDLQTKNDSGVLIPQDQYRTMLSVRGKQHLEDYKFIQDFSAKMKTFGSQALEYNKDYFLGDIVTVFDQDLQVVVDAQITAVRNTYDESGINSRQITFGFGQPTLAKKLKRRSY